MNPKYSRIINNSIIALAIISIIMGTAGWYAYFQQLGREVDIWAAFYNGLQLFFLNSDFESIHLPISLDIARFSAPLSLAGAVINGVLMHSRNGINYLRIWLTFRNHLIICGYTRRARLLIKDLIANHKDIGIVVIDEHYEFTGELQGKRLIFMKGNPASTHILPEAGIKKAAYVLLLDDDTNDLRTLNQLRKMNFQGKVILHLTDPNTTTIYKEMNRQLGLNGLHVISDAGILANRIVNQYSPDQYVSIKSPDDPPVHILFCGDDPMLVHLLREAGIMYQFANLKKPVFTIAVPEVSSFRETLNKQLPNLHQAVDYSIIDIHDLLNSDHSPATENNIILSIICCGEFAYSLDIGRRLRQIVGQQNKSLGKPEILLVESLAENQYVVADEILVKIKQLQLSYYNSLKHFISQTVIHDIANCDSIAKFIHTSFPCARTAPTPMLKKCGMAYLMLKKTGIDGRPGICT